MSKNKPVSFRHTGPINWFHDQVLRLYDEFDKMMPKSVWGVKWQPEFDIAQNEKGITITADISGMEEKDINIEVSSGVLTISGEKKIERDEKKDNYYLSERMSGYFSRSISIPETVDTDHIKAVFKNGVLQLNLPFSERNFRLVV